MALTAKQKAALSDDDFAVPGKRKLPIHDKTHVTAAWHMLMRTRGLTDNEVFEGRRRILARAKRFGIDTSGWKTGQKVSKESFEYLPPTGSSIMRDLTASLQNLGLEGLNEPAAALPLELDEGEIGGVTLESFDAVDAASRGLEDAQGVMDELYDSHTSLESIALAIEATLADGGMSPQTAAMAQTALANEQKRLGVAGKTVSLEAFAEETREVSTQVSLESVKETLKKVWESIVKVAKAIWDAIKRFFDAIVNWLGSAGKKAGELIKRIKKNTTKSLKISLESVSLEDASGSAHMAEPDFRWLLTDGKLISKGSLNDLDAVLKYPEVFYRNGLPENLLEATHYDTDEAKHRLKGELASILKGWAAKAHECGFTEGTGAVRTSPLMPGDVRFVLTLPRDLAEGSDAIQALHQVANGPDFTVKNNDGKNPPKEVVLLGSWTLEILESVGTAEEFIKQNKKSLDEVIANCHTLLDQAKSRLVDNDKYFQQAVRIYLQGMGRQIQNISKVNHASVSIMIKVVRAIIKVGEAYAHAA